MRIGIDLDNTLVCYDDLFWSLAVERGWVSREVPRRKERVRDELRRLGQESDWTLLQGEVYGARMREALPFPNAIQMLRELKRRNWSACIVSHRTRAPFAGPQYDLHEAAVDWLSHSGFLNESETGLSQAAVYLETTKVEKLARIGSLGLTWFIDDLPELLSEPTFPSHVRRMLFDPHRHCPPLDSTIAIAHEWLNVPDLLAGAPHD